MLFLLRKSDNLKPVLSGFLVALLVAGCAVKPRPMDLRSAIDSATEDLQRLLADRQNPAREIGLAEAIARAMKHNRQRRVTLMETAIASQSLSQANYDMLPDLTASAGYNSRNKPDSSTSGINNNGVITRPQPPVYSVSTDDASFTFDLEFSWNILDFGLSYVRAEQKADRYLIARERERKAIQNLIQDVREAYWRAASAQRLLGQVVPLKNRVNAALADARIIEKQMLKSPIESLTYQRELLDIRRSFEKIQKDLLDARSNIATLMGMKPNARFKLKNINETDYKVPELQIDVETLEKNALAKRPELMESRYQQRITLAEGRAALYSLLPGIKLSTGLHYDGNSYLEHSDWMNYGALISGNLFNIFKYPLMKKQQQNSEQLNLEKRLALMAGIMTQVHLADMAYGQAKQQFSTADEYLKIVRKISEHLKTLKDVNRGGELELIREELNTVVAELRRDSAYAELQNSFGRVFFTAGIDPFPEQIKDSELSTLKDAINNTLSKWEEGDIGLVSVALQDQVNTWTGPGEHQFQFYENTFLMGGNVQYNAMQKDGSPLPLWLSFDAPSRSFIGNPPASFEKVDVSVQANNQYQTRASDNFTLTLEMVNDTPIALPGEQYPVNEDQSIIMGQLTSIDGDNDEITFMPAEGEKLPAGMKLQKDGMWTYKKPPFYAVPRNEKKTVLVNAIDPYNAKGQTQITIGNIQ